MTPDDVRQLADTAERLVRIAQVEVVQVDRLPLSEDPTGYDAALEGFPHWSWDSFVEFFCTHMRCTPDTEVTRIRWTYQAEPQLREKLGAHL